MVGYNFQFCCLVVEVISFKLWGISSDQWFIFTIRPLHVPEYVNTNTVVAFCKAKSDYFVTLAHHIFYCIHLVSTSCSEPSH